MTAPVPTTYDSVAYPSYTHAQTHPEQLATKALLFGLRSAPVETCRVLELGCGDGANLISFAQQLPGATFVGVDLAAAAVERGQQVTRELGLENVSLRAMSVMDIGPDFGEFDYIIAHGIYSWVPEPVREKILSIASVNLAPLGVAQISYQAQPGGHMRDMVREMMLYHVRGFTDPDERVHQSMALVKFLGEAAKPGPEKTDVDPYRQWLRYQFAHLEERDKTTIYHDELCETHRAFWFHEFMEAAERHGLQFLAEADYVRPEESGYTPETVRMLRAMAGNRLKREQYQDFLGFRRFRQTLLCKQGLTLRFGMPPSELARLHLSCPARPVAPDFELTTTRSEKFQGERNSSFEIDKPFAKAALVILAEAWPKSVSFPDLMARARARLGWTDPAPDPNPDALNFFEAILLIYVPGLLSLHLCPPRFVRVAGDRPRAGGFARWQSSRFRDVNSLRHVHMTLADPVERALLRLMDGTRDQATLRAELERLRAETPPSADQPVPPLEEILDRFGRLALLEA